MSKKSILIVEDDTDLLEALCVTFENAKYDIKTSTDAQRAIELLNQFKFDVILSDINLGRDNGLELLERLNKLQFNTPVILMTAFGKISDAVKAIKLGAVDYLTKPFSAEVVVEKTDKIIAQYENQSLVYRDPKIKAIVELVKQVAVTNASVLINGESGTGKEVIAQYIHTLSNRTGDFIAINCAAIPDNMLEAIMFGYEKGAFTGAYQNTEGKVELANNGTLLLDEITEMPLTLQAKLLRVLQEQEVERLGSKKTVKVNTRIIATSNRNLSEEVNKGTFRKDLYFRLNVFPITIPPLRERKQDILTLAEYFIKKFAAADSVNPLNAYAKQKLENYAWPGNVRELQNVIHRAIIISNGQTIDADHIIYDELESHTASTSTSLNESMIQQENDHIIRVLEEAKGNREACAQKLGVSSRTLRNKLARMKKMGIKINGREE